MSKSNLDRSIGPLSVGNIVSAALRIYRDHFKSYFSLALQAYLWIFVPIYGWAKLSAILGLISRLAFAEISEQPESLNETRRLTDSRKWTFLLAGLFMVLFLFAGLMGFIMVLVTIAIVLSFGLSAILQNSPALLAIAPLLTVVLLIISFWGYAWLYSRLSLVELPIAVEDVNASSAISRSWRLTQGFVGRLIGVFLIAFLISLPFVVVIQLISNLIAIAMALVVPQDSSAFDVILLLATLPLALLSNSLIAPFWQTLKAVVYYDIRSRREGIDLQIRDI